ncbi:MAG: hypothetical protein NTY83_03005 [Candidatus Micrarchaeota archaeon]|nr:hypothetical protein [Candidatus Micrarchaeota archaeon]
MVTRVPVEITQPVLPTLQVGSVHKRVVVQRVETGEITKLDDVRETFTQMRRAHLKPRNVLASDSEMANIADAFADLFVNAISECNGWNEKVAAIVVDLKKGNYIDRALGAAIEAHAGQLWAARHM